MSQDTTFKLQPQAGPSRRATDGYYPAQNEPAKQLVTFGWLTKKHGKKVCIWYQDSTPRWRTKRYVQTNRSLVRVQRGLCQLQPLWHQ